MEKRFSWWQEQMILPKNNFQALFEIILNFHYFCKVHACRISVKNLILQKLPKIVEKHFSRWQEQIILPKYISLALFEIVQNCGETLLLMSGINNLAKKYFLSTIWCIVLHFHFFVRPAPVSFPLKFNFPKIA